MVWIRTDQSLAVPVHYRRPAMQLILILEDNPVHLREAVETARLAGFTEFEVTRFATDARLYLEKALAQRVPLPDAMIVDLDLGVESGFEVLRYWHSNPALKPIPLIVWTVMGDHERQICELFGVSTFITKQDGSRALLEALTGIMEDEPPEAGRRPV